MTTTVNNIEHIESQSVRGTSVIKMYFQPGTDINGAVAQVTAICQTLIKPLPPGITPPLILQYNAADVPVIMLSLGSDQLSEQEITDLGNNFIRTQLVTVQGAAVPLPYGGKTRVVNVDVDPDALYARGLSPQDVVNAMLAQNLIVAPGTAKMGPIEYDVGDQQQPRRHLDDLNDIPISYVNGALVYVRDVGFVHDGFQPQTNLVRRDGRHSVAAAGADERQRLDAGGRERRAQADADHHGRHAQEPERSTISSIRASSCAPSICRRGARRRRSPPA